MRMEPGGIRCLKCELKLSIACFGVHTETGKPKRWCLACCRTTSTIAAAKVKRRRGRTENGDNYRSRNLVLASMGFEDYSKYLASGLWRDVRAKVFAAKGHDCRLCDGPATELHHNRYTHADLTGKCIAFIEPICRACHDRIEFDRKGRKMDLNAVRSRYHNLRNNKSKARPQPPRPERIVDWR